MNVKHNGKKCKIEDLKLEIGESVALKIAEIEEDVKVIRICHQDEIVYIATNQTDIDDTELIEMYKKRWQVETNIP